VATYRLTVVSDSHLSEHTPEAGHNWDAVVRHIAADGPDLVIHAGDLTAHGADDGDEIGAARDQLDRLASPWRAVPGNHDIGDNPWDGQADGAAVSDERRRPWLDTIGADWWACEAGDWQIVAVDAQLFGSGLDAEAEQQEWLATVLGDSGQSRPVLFVSHKPIDGPSAELAMAPPYRFLPAGERERLEAQLRRRGVRMVVSGHVHQYRVLDLNGMQHLWAPTTWSVLPDAMQPLFGAKRCGVLALELFSSGTAVASLVEPTGIGQLTLGVDVANPYAH
jgi:3',5'-cyclic AMP phosphodiesterase CpdA